MHHDILPSRQGMLEGQRECTVSVSWECAHNSHESIPGATNPHKMPQQLFLIETFFFPMPPNPEVLTIGGILDKTQVFNHLWKKIFCLFFNGKMVFVYFCANISQLILNCLQLVHKKTSGGVNKRLHPSNPLNSETVLMFLSTNTVRNSVLDILATAPNFFHVHFSWFQSSLVAKILFLPRVPDSSSTNLAYCSHA